MNIKYLNVGILDFLKDIEGSLFSLLICKYRWNKFLKCPYSEFFLSVFSRIPVENGEILFISSYSVQMWENTEQKNSEYGQFSRMCILEDHFITFR